MTIATHFSLEDQQQLRQTIEAVARKRVVPRAAEIDAKAEYPQDMFDLLTPIHRGHQSNPAQYHRALCDRCPGMTPGS